MNRVLVTGASGFVGAAVTRLLIEQSREVAIILRTTSDNRRIDKMLDKVHVIKGDLSVLEEIKQNVKDFRPDAILHLGWQGVKGRDRNSINQVDNISASVDLYRLSMECDCRAFVGMGSQAEYGPSTGKLDETSKTKPTTVYGIAKLATCQLLDRISLVQSKPFAWLRLFSSYGPGDDPSWLLQYLGRTLLKRQRPALTAAQQMWDYIYVDDAAQAMIATMDAKAKGIFNLGSGEAIKLEKIIMMMRDLIDPSLPLGLGEIPYREDQVMHLEANISKLTAVTGWTPSVSIRKGLEEVLLWLRNH